MGRKLCKRCEGGKLQHEQACLLGKGCLNGGSIVEVGCTCEPKPCPICHGTGDRLPQVDGVRFEKGDFHDGPGWYFWYEDYPDEGSVGAFATRKEAYDYAKACEDPPSVTDGCEVCGQFPYLSETGMCGPCTFGTADAIGEGDVYA